MGFTIEINSLLVLPEEFNIQELKEKNEYSIIKQGQRIFSINIPLEFCDYKYKYLGKIVINKLEITSNQTKLEFSILKIFNDLESKIFSENFIKPTK